VKEYSRGGGLGSLFDSQSSAEGAMSGMASDVAASAGDAAGRAFIERLKQETRADANSVAPQMR
jgi:hypothetical protein